MIYLVNKETNEVVQTFTNVQNWGENYVEFLNGGFLGKIYADDNEYFTDIIPQEEIIE